jgi:hypothetical protein
MSQPSKRRRIVGGVVALALAGAALGTREWIRQKIRQNPELSLRLAFDPAATGQITQLLDICLIVALVLGVLGAVVLVRGLTTRPPDRSATGSQATAAAGGRRTLVSSIALAAVLGGLFFGYRGYEYQRCRSACLRDCFEEAESGNPFASFGARNDVGRALCERQAKDCAARCRFP